MNASTKPKEKRRVYIVEPHPVAGAHLAAVLGRDPAVEIVISAIDLPAGATLSHKFSVLVVDGDALPFPLVAYLRTVRELYAHAQILVTAKCIPDDELCRLLFHGVRGFVAYDLLGEQLCPAVEAVSRGHTWVPPEVLDHYVVLSSGQTCGEHIRQGLLTPRESQVVGLLQRRLCDKEISSALSISRRTVRFHLQNIFQKLAVHDRYSLIEWGRAMAVGFRAEGAGGLQRRDFLADNHRSFEGGSTAESMSRERRPRASRFRSGRGKHATPHDSCVSN